MGGARKNIFHNNTLYEKTRILLRNALIISTTTYALHTRNNTQHELTKLEKFQFNCIRQIQNPRWCLQEQKKSRKQLYVKYKQSLIHTWLQKMDITQHLHQTTKQWNIHNHTQSIVLQQEHKWKQQWEMRKKLHTQEHTAPYNTEQLQQYNYMQYSKEKGKNNQKTISHT